MAAAESFMVMQIRTEKRGLAASLHQRQVPGMPTATLICGRPRQTAKHVIIFCRLNKIKKSIPNVRIAADYHQLLNTPQRLKTVTTQFMNTGLLSQFSKAVQQLYQR